jgi:hypothetical protein
VEAYALKAAGQPSLATERCAQTWAVLLDVSRLDLFHSTAALLGMTHSIPDCLRALEAVPLDAREPIASRWAQLSTRIASNPELLENSRIAGTVDLFGGHFTGQTRKKLAAPNLDGKGPQALWPQWDALFRKLIAAADSPDAKKLGKELMELELEKGVLSGVTEDSVVIADDMRRLVAVLSALAKGTAVPSGTVVEEDNLYFPYANKQRTLRLRAGVSRRAAP